MFKLLLNIVALIENNNKLFLIVTFITLIMLMLDVFKILKLRKQLKKENKQVLRIKEDIEYREVFK